MYKIITTLKCDLGEGLLWDYLNDRLLLTDINSQLLISVDVNSASYQSWDMPSKIGWVLLSGLKNSYYIGLQNGINFFVQESSLPPEPINTDFPGKVECRLNDACVDFLGRIWFGSMNFVAEERKDGALASFSRDEGLKIHDDGFTVTNGPLISQDSKFLLLTDSIRQVIYRYDLSISDGVLSNRREFVKFNPNEGFPDGMCFDVDGNLWVAMWGAGKVIKINPHGQIIREFVLPAPNLTNVCFGGRNFNRLFVSSARAGLSEQNLNNFPNSGALFEIDNHNSVGFRANQAR